MKIKHYSHWTKNLVIMLWWKLLLFLGFKRSAEPIPEGQYCYSPNVEKNKARKNFSVYYTNPCKYYKTLGHNYNGCSYLGIITDDMTFDDQCKMCAENYGDDD